MKRLIATMALAGLAACSTGDGNDPAKDVTDEYRSSCDEHGNRVYVTEDDKNASPGIFVVPGDCSTADRSTDA